MEGNDSNLTALVNLVNGEIERSDQGEVVDSSSGMPFVERNSIEVVGSKWEDAVFTMSMVVDSGREEVIDSVVDFKMGEVVTNGQYRLLWNLWSKVPYGPCGPFYQILGLRVCV